MKNNRISVGLVGAGWAGEMHAKAYERVYGVPADLKTVCALSPDLAAFARRYNFRNWTEDFNTLLEDPEIDVIDIASPPGLHKDMIIKALEAGKHVICEKPLTGYFGLPGDSETVGDVSKEKMLTSIRKDIDEIEKVLRESGRTFFYAENWLYAPAFVRACDLVLKKRTAVLEIRSFAAHKGSHAGYVRTWAGSGGGTILRNLIHPIGAALYLKHIEAANKGSAGGVASLYCDCARVTEGIDKGHIAASPLDVEDYSHLLLTFRDGTKAELTSTDLCLGGLRNNFEIYGNDAVYFCRFNPNDLLEAYISDDRGLDGELLMEKSEHSLGYQSISIEDELVRGYYGEIQDFMECLRDGRQPRSGFSLAKEAMEIACLAYVSAEQGRRLDLRR